MAARRVKAMRYQVAWGRMTAAGVVAIEKQEEVGNVALVFALLKTKAVLWIRRGLELAR